MWSRMWQRALIWTPWAVTAATAIWCCARFCRKITSRPVSLPWHVSPPILGWHQISARAAAPSSRWNRPPILLRGASRADLIRKFGDFTDTSPALLRAAMSARLHTVLDALMGQGRVLMQEMALVKPPKISGDKPWHQDAAYFRGSDPNLMFGVWIALDPATRENGCMEVIPGSQLGGPVPHVPAEDINLCTIRPDLVRLEDRVAVPMDPGDVLIFHSLTHHYTAANRSDRRRRALQFHYHQVGLEWTSLAAHRELYHDADGAYAGCTVPKGAPFAEASSFVPSRLRPVVPMA